MKKVLAGVRLKRLREERNLTQKALASAIGISLSYLNQLENNQRPLTVPVLLKLGTAFGIDLQLFSEEDEARLISDCARSRRTPPSARRSPLRNCASSRATCLLSGVRSFPFIAAMAVRSTNSPLWLRGSGMIGRGTCRFPPQRRSRK